MALRSGCPAQSFLVPGCPNVLGTQLSPGGRSEACRWPPASQGPALLSAWGDTCQRPLWASSIEGGLECAFLDSPRNQH